MLENDYLMRLLLQFVDALRRSWFESKEKKDPKAAAETLEDAVGEATDIDGEALLALAPDSLVAVLQVSGTDPRVIEYVARSLALCAIYQREAGDEELADLRLAQAQALSDAYDLELPEDPEDMADLPGSDEELEDYLEGAAGKPLS